MLLRKTAPGSASEFTTVWRYINLFIIIIIIIIVLASPIFLLRLISVLCASALLFYVGYELNDDNGDRNRVTLMSLGI